jgi:hypothetical protein
MPRNAQRQPTRQHIAQLAARLMAEDGIEDYGAAKRKAARQAGAHTLQQLPDNEEIEVALREYRALYCSEHPQQLRVLRELALEVMDEFEAFQPQLTGAVLRGSAGRYAPIQLLLFADNSKIIEHRLLDQNIPFDLSTVRWYRGAQAVDFPVISFERGGVEIQLTLLSSDDLRSQPKQHPAGQPVERAKRAAVQALLAIDD